MRTILIDDREKRPYSFPEFDTEQARLDVGDYAIDGYERHFAIERKSLDDLATSCGAERDRFEREVKRAQSLARFAVIVEAGKADAQGGNYYSNIHPNSVIGTVEKWPTKYDTLHFEWCGSRDRAKERTVELLTEWDRQYLRPNQH